MIVIEKLDKVELSGKIRKMGGKSEKRIVEAGKKWNRMEKSSK